MSEYTADEIETAILNALARHDVQAVPDLVLLLNRVDPRRASTIYDTLVLGCQIAAANQPEVDG